MNAILIPLTLTFIATFAFLPPRAPKPRHQAGGLAMNAIPSSERKDEAMKREEFELLIELALAVHQLAPPDRQRSISRKVDAMEAAARILTVSDALVALQYQLRVSWQAIFADGETEHAEALRHALNSADAALKAASKS